MKRISYKECTPAMYVYSPILIDEFFFVEHAHNLIFSYIVAESPSVWSPLGTIRSWIYMSDNIHRDYNNIHRDYNNVHRDYNDNNNKMTRLTQLLIESHSR